jgi:hypothetical protein
MVNNPGVNAVVMNGDFLDRKDLDQMFAEVESAAKRK